jgi:LIVCS family branched-chain amino acid:cation transporter
MKLSQQVSLVWATGVAIFSLFFGAGNVVFPLTLGFESGHMVGFALIGLTITAIGGPLLGLFGAVLFDGDCKKFFCRIGVWPGYLAVLLIILLIGPFGAMPRSYIVSYSAIKTYMPDMSLFAFNNIAGLLTLVLIWKRNLVLPILGYFLSPILLISLAVIIIASIYVPGSYAESSLSASAAFSQGLSIGYDTLDLLASIFFAITIWSLLKERILPKKNSEMIPIYSYSSILGGAMLILAYLGLSAAAAKHHTGLQGAAPDEILATLAVHLLGAKLSIIANVAVALACLTTVMGLCVTIADVIHQELEDTAIFKKIPYNYDLMIFLLLFVTVIVANLGFAKIMSILHPIILICYPAIIALTICNILYKLFGFRFVKVPVYTTLALTVLYINWPV